MSIPFYIPLAKERAASFRRAVDLFISHFTEDHSYSKEMWHDLWTILRPYYRDEMCLTEPFQIDVPLVIDHALIWATTRPLPSDAELRRALSLLKETLADWSDAWMVLARLLDSSGYSLSERHWFREIVPLAMVRHRQATRSLSEAWPLALEEDEKKALGEMRDGNAVGLEDAFARIAGLTKEEWIDRVAKYRKQGTTEE